MKKNLPFRFFFIFLFQIYHTFKFFLYPRIYIKDLPETMLRFNQFSKSLYHNDFKKRLSYVKKNKLYIDENLGYKIINFSQIIEEDKIVEIQNIFKKKFESINWEKNSKKNKPYLMRHAVNLNDESLKDLINILEPFITNYIGSLPIVADASFWFSPNKENYHGSASQNWHRDPEDYKQIRVFFPLDSITEDSGPLNIISAVETDKIFKQLFDLKIVSKRNEKVNDNIILDQVENKNNFKKIILDDNQIGMVDTARCYHFGSRKSTKPRKVLQILFYSAFNPRLFLFRKYKKNSNWTEKEKLLYGLTDQIQKVKPIWQKK